MGVRTPLLTFGLAAGILLAGTGLGLRASAGAAPAAREVVGASASAGVADTIAAPLSAPVVVTPATTGTVAPAASLPAPKDAPATAILPEMKHVWQTLNNCGPAAVTMALSTFGVDTDQETARLALRGPDVRRGMGPQGVGPWVRDSFGLRSMWRNDGTNAVIRRLVANGFAPMVTQWMQDPSVSRISHWRTVRGYDDAKGVFYVNDSMLGSMVPLSYDWFGRNWQSFSYRYMVIYRSEDEPLLQAIVGTDWSETTARESLYERARAEALAQNTNFAWLAYGEAAYANGIFDEAVAAFEQGFAMGSAAGVFGVRNSYPQALRALGRRQDADVIAQKINGVTPVPSTATAEPDPYALFLFFRRTMPFERVLTE